MKPLDKNNDLHHHGYNDSAADGEPVIETAFKKEVPANLHHEAVHSLLNSFEAAGWRFWNAEKRNNRLHLQVTPAGETIE